MERGGADDGSGDSSVNLHACFSRVKGRSVSPQVYGLHRNLHPLATDHL